MASLASDRARPAGPGHGRAATLLAQFGVIALLVVTALGWVISARLQAVIATRAQANAEASAEIYVQLAAQQTVDPRSGLPVGNPVELGRRLMDNPVITEQVLAATAWFPDGTVAFATATQLVGTTEELSDVAERALTDGVTTSFRATADRVRTDGFDVAAHADDPVLVVLTPISIAGDDAPEAVVELVTTYTATREAVAHDVRVMHLWLGAGLLVLYVTLFRLVASASRKLRQQSAANRAMALHDSLTGLPNRTLLRDRVTDAVAAGPVALLLLDLDRFKEINDTLGHHYGDLLLTLVGPRLAAALTAAGAEGATIARLGGDEFVVLLPGADSPDAAGALAAAVLAALDQPFVVEHLELDVGCSLGIAVSPGHGEDFETLLRHADVAMYAAKAQQSGIAVYDPGQDAHSPARLALLGELRRGIDAGQLVLHFQPKVDVATGAVIGAEALVRWAHPTRGLVGPDVFIPLAERTGVIRPLTAAVLDLALAQTARWSQAGHPLPVAVNISARSLLDHSLLDAVDAALARHEVPPELLELEITESAVMEDPDRALAVLRSLAGRGVELSIDDFGIGHSSLAYLRRLPVHELKIDRSFVADLVADEGRAIVATSIDLARRLGLRVVAEGVEDQATWDSLAELGCEAAQGYHLCRPMPADDVTAWLAARAVVAP